MNLNPEIRPARHARRATLVDAAAQTPKSNGAWRLGLVSGCDAEDFIVSCDGVQLRASRADSCLLKPQLSDTVACLDAPQGLWIFAVLQRAATSLQHLHLHGDTRIEVQTGVLQLAADRIELDGKQVVLRAGETQVATESAEVVGRHLRVTGTVLKVVGSVLTTVMNRVSHYSRHHVRTTEGIDRVSATHVEQEAHQLLRLSGEHTLINGEKLVKTRGNQIHFG